MPFTRFKKKWKLRRLYSVREFIFLLYALFVDKLFRRIPGHVFLRNVVLTALDDRGADIRTEDLDLVVRMNDTSYRLRNLGSDLMVFNQIILNEELAMVARYARNLKKKNIVIMDCGANIGMSTLFFKKSFPESTVLSVEPEKKNFQYLQRNISDNNLSDIFTFELGVWSEKTTLYPNRNFRDGKEWSFSLQETASKERGIAVDSIPNIVALAGLNAIDILKIDIEGAEFKLFEKFQDWRSLIDNVKILSVEIHEEFGSAWYIEEILLKYGFRIRRSGELVLGIRDECI